MKDFKFVGISKQGLRVYECLRCGDRLTDVSIKSLKLWHNDCIKTTEKCKHGVPKDAAHYCLECVSGIPRKCKNCKEYLMDDWAFCPRCGFETK